MQRQAEKGGRNKARYRKKGAVRRMGKNCKEDIETNGDELKELYRKTIIEIAGAIDNLNYLVKIYSFVQVFLE